MIIKLHAHCTIIEKFVSPRKKENNVVHLVEVSYTLIANSSDCKARFSTPPRPFVSALDWGALIGLERGGPMTLLAFTGKGSGL